VRRFPFSRVREKGGEGRGAAPVDAAFVCIHNRHAPCFVALPARHGDVCVGGYDRSLSEASPYILVVDDEPGILQMLQDVLAMEGYRSAGVASPAAVIDMTERHRPDLFLIDLMLPGCTGIDLAHELRSLGCRQTPMIGMSASSSIIQVARDSGLFGTCIAKPFELASLLDDIQRLLNGT
jgi:CheY-like chemotaxis protein